MSLSTATCKAIDEDCKNRVVGAAPGAPPTVGVVPALFLLSTAFQLILPVLIKVLQDLAARGETPTAANVFKAGHEATS